MRWALRAVEEIGDVSHTDEMRVEASPGIERVLSDRSM